MTCCTKICTVLLCLASLAGCRDAPENDLIATSATDAAPTRDKPLIAVIESNQQGNFSEAIRAGMAAAALDQDLEVKSFACANQTESELLAQLKLAAQEQPDGVCIQPFVISDSVLTSLRKLHGDATPVLAFRHNLADDAVCCYVGTDHFHAGRRLANALVERVEENTRVFVLSSAEEDNQAVTRRRGFDFTITEEHNQFSIVPIVAEQAGPAIQELLAQIGSQTEAERSAVVTFSTLTTQALLVALEDERVPTSPLVIGFGAYPGLEDDLRAGRIACVLIEDPYIIGLSTLIAMASEINGESSGNFVSTGEHLITAGQLEDPGTRKLIKANLQ